MQYLVLRWNTGKRVGCNKPFSQYLNFYNINSQIPRPPPAHFQVGQPVSRQNFTNPLYANRHVNSINCSQRINAEEFEENSNLNGSRIHQRQSFASPSNGFALGEITKTPHCAKSPATWSGMTPPSKDTNSSLEDRRRNLFGTEQASLKSPEILRKYVERFNEIQTRLGIALDDAVN